MVYTYVVDLHKLTYVAPAPYVAYGNTSSCFYSMFDAIFEEINNLWLVQRFMMKLCYLHYIHDEKRKSSAFWTRI